jgi:hypothetical protein
MLVRFVFNSALFAVLIAAVGVFGPGRGHVDTPVLVGITAAAALWAGALVAAIETRVRVLPARRRLLWSACCGGLAYLGLFAGLLGVTKIAVSPLVLVGGCLLGALSHGARSQVGDDDTEDDTEDDTDDNDDNGADDSASA